MNREEMLKELTALDFYTLDLQLYLDTHPNDLKALEKYNAAAEEAGVLRHEYEKLNGPMYSFRSQSRHPWQWANDPWPWQYQFNFKLTGDDR